MSEFGFEIMRSGYIELECLCYCKRTSTGETWPGGMLVDYDHCCRVCGAASDRDITSDCL